MSDLVTKRSNRSGANMLITVEDVLSIRQRLAASPIALQDAFGAPQPLYPDRLDSAVARQHTGFGDTVKYEKTHEVAATLFYGLTMCHAFENGNKRTALVTFLVFVDRAGYILVNTTEEDLYDLVTSVADHRIANTQEGKRDVDAEVEAIAHWIRSRIQKIERGDKVKNFRDLRQYLAQFDCHFDDPDRNFITIRRGARKTKTGYPRENFDVNPKELKKIRKELGLTELDGVTNNELYSINDSVDDFVRKYSLLLNRLSEV